MLRKGKSNIEILAEANIKDNNKLLITPSKHKEVIYSFLDSLFVEDLNPLDSYEDGIFLIYQEQLFVTNSLVNAGENPTTDPSKFRILGRKKAANIELDTTGFNKNLSATENDLQKALQKYNDTNLGHIIKDNGTAKTARTNLNLVGFTITDNLLNDSTDITIDLSTKADLINGKVDPNQIPKMAIVDTYNATSNTLAGFISTEWSATIVEKGDVVKVVDSVGTINEYLIAYGDGSNISHYLLLYVSKIEWGNILNKPTDFYLKSTDNANGITVVTTNFNKNFNNTLNTLQLVLDFLDDKSLGHQIDYKGTVQIQRDIIDFLSDSFDITDDFANNKIKINLKTESSLTGTQNILPDSKAVKDVTDAKQNKTLTQDYVWVGNSVGVAQERPTATSQLTVGDFTAPYTAFATESNWVNNLMITNAPAGVAGSTCFGTFENGTKGLVKFTQGGWQRFYNDSQIKSSTTIGASIIAWLVTTATWATNGFASNTTAGFGDTGQEYIVGNTHYVCRSNDGTNHTWEKIEIFANSVVVNGAYVPVPYKQLNVANASTFVVEGYFDLISVIAIAETTTACNISIGSAAGLADVVPVTALPVVVGKTKKLQYLDDVNFPTSANRTLYVTISSAATVTLFLIKQKLFE